MNATARQTEQGPGPMAAFDSQVSLKDTVLISSAFALAVWVAILGFKIAAAI